MGWPSLRPTSTYGHIRPLDTSAKIVNNQRLGTKSTMSRPTRILIPKEFENDN
jgi:hypothetical protein